MTLVQTYPATTGDIVDNIGAYIDAKVAAITAIGTYATSVGDGSATSYTTSHNLGTTDVQVTVIDLTTNQIVYPTVTIVNGNEITVTFSVAPSANEMRVLVVSV